MYCPPDGPDADPPTRKSIGRYSLSCIRKPILFDRDLCFYHIIFLRAASAVSVSGCIMSIGQRRESSSIIDYFINPTIW
jgi:hypothetical protein